MGGRACERRSGLSISNIGGFEISDLIRPIVYNAWAVSSSIWDLFPLKTENKGDKQKEGHRVR